MCEILEIQRTEIFCITFTDFNFRLLGELSSYLDGRLAVRTSVHGVLVDVYGLGVLIQGDSGIGKSETALELIKRGHRLIADDRVDVYQQDELTVVGEPPKFCSI